ncbi:NAD(P)/FAD-dependent oxidoreductase [Alteraurantiacibacter aquimixticola]|uniref:FAD-dependent oxidoreductase n=1 Tax=Alteraurantiacibacter aquimixticola TaxID=2489173 RepID=A0A4V4U8W0_9SPHN|nr:FAD-dependent oxidoreductase [Alteraurantiacibacter aquimixticola]TIX51557.1 FAD-dependent oxidoreductase [Alteraurantiacibacter aquimixticola]
MSDNTSTSRHVAIIGAGMAGMSCARRLGESGWRVSLFDKGRGPGGRMSTRWMEHNGQQLRFDHGAQYFTADDALMARQVDEWHAAGVVERWPPDRPGAWVGAPCMNAPLKHMAQSLDISFATRIEMIERGEGGYRLRAKDAQLPDTFDDVVIAVPAEQAAMLAFPIDRELVRLAVSIRSAPCWTLMCAFGERLDAAHDSYRSESAIAWAARNNAKPGRGEAECWVIQAGAEWSRQHLESRPDAIAAALLAEFAELTGIVQPKPVAEAAHRWRYAFPAASDRGYLWDSGTRMGACGDWLRGPTVGDAWMSGRLLADAIFSGG